MLKMQRSEPTNQSSTPPKSRADRPRHSEPGPWAKWNSGWDMARWALVEGFHDTNDVYCHIYTFGYDNMCI
jgi:hypothetical protein